MNAVKPISINELSEKFEQILKGYNEKYLIMYRIGIATGLRISDILELKVRIWRQRSIKVKEQKTGKLRIIVLPPELKAQIKRYAYMHELAPTDYLIPSNSKNKGVPLSRVQAYNVMKQASDELGIKGIGTHSLRKTYALNHFRTNHDMEKLRKEMNHKYITTTVCYLFDVDNLNKLPL